MLFAVDIVFVSQYLSYTLRTHNHLLRYRSTYTIERSVNVCKPKLHILLTYQLVSFSECCSLNLPFVLYQFHIYIYYIGYSRLGRNRTCNVSILVCAFHYHTSKRCAERGELAAEHHLLTLRLSQVPTMLLPLPFVSRTHTLNHRKDVSPRYLGFSALYLCCKKSKNYCEIQTLLIYLRNDLQICL